MNGTITAIGDDQRKAAKVAGVVYLLAMAASMFAEMYARGPLIVRGDHVETAARIAASETLFRLNIVIHLMTFATDVILAAAFFVILRHVSIGLALVGAFWRVADAAILATAVLIDIAALRLLSNAQYLQAFSTEQLQSMARLLLNLRGYGFSIGFVFLGFGSTLFACLWLRSGYIPRWLAKLGIFSSMTLAGVTLAILLVPALGAMGLIYMFPMFVYEVTLGIWLIARPLRPAV